MAPFDPSRIDVEDFLDCLEVRNLSKATEQEWRFSCPLPSHEGTDESPSCYMNAKTTAFLELVLREHDGSRELVV